MEKEKKLALLILFVYAIVGGYTLWHHEMWRDELQAWSIARDSASLVELHKNLRYESHPILWHGSLYLLSSFWDSPAIMQLFNYCLALGSLALLLLFAPFPFWVKGGLAFHYFLFYEYLILCRNYVIGLFLVLLATVLYTNNRKGWSLGVTLFLLCQTSIYGLILALAFLALLIYEKCSQRRFIGAFVIVAAIFTILQVLPPADSAVMQKELSLFPKLQRTAASYWQGIFPLMPFVSDFKDKNFIENDGLGGLLGLLVLVLLTHSFYETDKGACAFFGVASFTLLLFIHFIHHGALRHHGHFFIILLLSLWICGKEKMPQITKVIGVLIVVIGLIASCWAHYCDIKHPFSAAYATAQFIKANGLSDQYFAGHLDAGTSAVSAYLGKPFFYLNGQREGSFIIWSEDRLKLDGKRAIGLALKNAKGKGKSLVLITTYPMKQYKELASFKGVIVPSESFWVYRFSQNKKKVTKVVKEG